MVHRGLRMGLTAMFVAPLDQDRALIDLLTSQKAKVELSYVAYLAEKAMLRRMLDAVAPQVIRPPSSS